jgi:hypothetical protein
LEWFCDQNYEGVPTMPRLRVRFTVRQMMVVIVFMALVSALVIQSIRTARRDREIARLVRSLNDYRQSADRIEWAERMHQKGYVSKAVLANERLSFERASRELDRHD